VQEKAAEADSPPHALPPWLTSFWGCAPILRLGRTSDIVQTGRNPFGREPEPSAPAGPPAIAAQARLEMEARGFRAVVQRLSLTRESGQLALEVGNEHVGHVVAEAPLHYHPERSQVGAVLRERVRRHQPSPFAKRVRDVEDSEVVDLRSDGKSEHREFVSACEQLERAEVPDLARKTRGDVAGVGLHPPETVEAEPQEVVVLRDDLRPRP